jgi:hypothetical protein
MSPSDLGIGFYKISTREVVFSHGMPPAFAVTNIVVLTNVPAGSDNVFIDSDVLPWNPCELYFTFTTTNGESLPYVIEVDTNELFRAEMPQPPWVVQASAN